MKPAEPAINPSKIIERKADILQKPRDLDQKYAIEGVQFQPRGMVCANDKNSGQTVCEIPYKPNLEVVFSLENLAEYQEMIKIDDHMSKEFEDTCLIDLSGGK